MTYTGYPSPFAGEAHESTGYESYGSYEAQESPGFESYGTHETYEARETHGADEAHETAWTEHEQPMGFEGFTPSPAPVVVHQCRPGEGPPAAVPDPEGKGAHPLVLRGTGPRYSRNPTVGHAQQLLNRFLAETGAGFASCVDQTPQRLSYMQSLRAQLRRNGQDPLVVDCRFGLNTEMATKMFQACRGLVRDGKIGPVTWSFLRKYETVAPTPTPTDPNPPDRRCSGPDAVTTEVEFEHDFVQPEYFEEARRVVVRPRLSFFVNETDSAQRNHFQCGAVRQARRMSAYEQPRVDACTPRRIGATSYNTGADILAAISAARACTEQRVDRVHIFSHSGWNGIYGNTLGSDGLYITANASSIATGARSISDVPVTDLAEDVVFVLHGCDNAAGADNFARKLYEHLAASLKNPKVFGHYNTGCASRDNSWREYSNRVPGGSNVRSIAPHYTDVGCCTAPKKEAFEVAESSYGESLYESQYAEAPRPGTPCCASCAAR